MAVCFVLWLLSVLAPAWVAAQPAAPSASPVRWEAPVVCPPEAEVVAEIERLLGRPLDDQVRVQAVIRADADGFALELRLEQDGTESERALADPSCEGLSHAGALVIALAIDPTVLENLPREAEAQTDVQSDVPSEADPEPDASGPDASRPGADEAVPPPPAEPEVGEPDAAESNAEPGAEDMVSPIPLEGPPPEPAARPNDAPDEGEAPGAPPAFRFVGQASAILSAGPLPAPSPGGALSLGLGYDVLEVTLGGYVAAPQEGLLAGDSMSGGTVGLAAAVLRGCAAFEAADGALEFVPCGAFELGAAWATGVGVPIVRSGAALWTAFAVGGRLRFWFVDAVGLEARADMQVPLLRAPFVLTIEGERREFHRAFEVGGIFGLGMVVRVQ